MGHYSDCYERDEEEARKRYIPLIESKTKEIEKLIEKYGLAGYLAREKVGY